MATTNIPPNLKSRRETRRKKDQCQTCGTKVSLAKQFSVTNDLENGKVKVGKARADANHYCADCRDKRVKRGEYFIKRREEGTWGETLNGKPKRKAAKKTATKTTARKAVQPKAQKARKAKKAAKPKATPSIVDTTPQQQQKSSDPF